jgi:hypothetical protein
MALTGGEKVSVVSHNGIPVARSLDELDGTSAYDGLNLITTGGSAPVTVAMLKAGDVPAGHSVPQAGTTTAIAAADLNDHFDPPITYSGPLDLVAGAAVAYSVRALAAARLGMNLVKVGGVNYAADAATGDAPAISSGGVSVWYDQSGNGINLGQATTAKQYAWSASGPGDRPVVVMDSTVVGGQALVTTDNVSLPNGAFTVFAVAKLPGTVDDPNPYLIGINTDAGDPTLNISLIGDPADQIEFFAAVGSDNVGGRSSHIAHGLTDYALFEIAWTLGTKVVRINGTSVSVVNDEDTTAITDPIAKPMALGVIDPADLANQDSGFAELLIYPSVLSSSDRTAIRANIATYYGITLS